VVLGVGFIELRIRARLLGGFSAQESGYGARVVGAVVPSVIVAHGLARASVFGSVSRGALLTAVLRAGGLIGLAGTLGPLVDDFSGLYVALGGMLDEDDLRFFVEPMVTSLVLLAWTIGAGRAVGTGDADAEPAAPRHVLAGAAATLAAALVGPIAGMVNGWRWRAAMYAAAEAETRRERSTGTLVRAFGGVLFLDGLPGPVGLAQVAAVLVAGFTVLVVIAAVAGQRREISR
jgi:hypothetical protein